MPRSSSSRTRRCALTSALAVTNNFASASGAMTVPMSRPSSTAPPSCAAKSRCRWSKRVADRRDRTRSSEAIRETGSLRNSSSSGSKPSSSQALSASNSFDGSPPQRHSFERDGAIEQARCPCAAGRSAWRVRGQSCPSRSPPGRRRQSPSPLRDPCSSSEILVQARRFDRADSLWQGARPNAAAPSLRPPGF